MNLLSQIVAGFYAAVLVVVFVMEAFFYHRPELSKFTLMRSDEISPLVRIAAINIGFYNLTYALGLIIGLVLLRTEWVEAGRALVLFACAAHVVLGIVLYATERRLWAGALSQSVPPLIALVAFAVLG